MQFLILLLPFLVAVFLGSVIIPYVILVTYRKRLFDPVGIRKLHKTSIPRLGGVAFMPIQCCVLAISVVTIYKVPLVSQLIGNLNITTWVVFPMFIMLMCGLVILYLIGVADDLIGLSNKKKFYVQLFVASFFPLSGLWINNLYGLGFMVELSPWIGVPFTIFITVLIINAVNLIDGIDGLCSGLVAVACLFFGVLFAYYEAWIHALLSFITIGVLLPFFYFNVVGFSKRRRRIFMGDTGSMTLGYTIAFLAISFSMYEPAIKPFSEGAIIVAASVLIVPVFDVARVMVVRFLTKQPIFKPDRNHLHHKLIRAGMSHRSVMISIIMFSIFYAIFNIVLVQYISNNLLLMLNFMAWLVIAYIFNRVVETKYQKK
ncbi:MraY family glycosyltransferase [Sphingobacterium rhinopitheci]|uniref:MraY family glycosyltransferase n=1 Tax=Sphingobacterium rhinopitheci TaxID=2781960 RepID=UPI001F5168BA|nr:MraY family glycosyltransferase [Sphingobacterium rhinopitheci]MCI0920772.1 undecaprenyl/decaprenyl-phosphate alpha-N-acetylglucosaminyl 1-phosphate transferase [Sphingobacterium rhinopitheci]